MEREVETTGVEPTSQPARFMIAGEAPIVMEKACEIMVKEMTLRAWRHTERSRRRTLQRTDVHAAVGESEMFDFLIDLVPRVLPPAPAPGAPAVPAETTPPTETVPPPSEAAPLTEESATQELQQHQLPPTVEQEPQVGMNTGISDAETRYAHLQAMQSQMQDHYSIMQERIGAVGSVPAQGITEAEGQQPQVVLNPQLMIHPPDGAAMPQWQPNAPSGDAEEEE